MASGTPTPSPSSTRPEIVTCSPETPGLARVSFLSRVSPVEKKGPTVCDVVACGLISLASMRARIFPRSRVAPCEDDVELIAKGLLGDGAFPIENRDQSAARFFIRRTIENWVEGKKRVARKIHLRDKACSKCRAKHREMNVRRPPGVVMISPRIFARLNRDEPISAFAVSERVSAASKIRIEGSIVLVDFVQVTSRGVGLPDFDECVRNRPAVFIQHPSAHDDPFAERLTGMLPRQVAGFHIDGFASKDRAGYLGERMWHWDQGFLWRSLDGRHVRRMQVIRLGSRIGSSVACDSHHALLLLLFVQRVSRQLARHHLTLCFAQCFFPQWDINRRMGRRLSPCRVSAYSTRGGT